jgi:hypothetical protein
MTIEEIEKLVEELQARMNDRATAFIAKHRSMTAPMEDTLELYGDFGMDVAEHVIQTFAAYGLSPGTVNIPNVEAGKEILLADMFAEIVKHEGLSDLDKATLRAAFDEGYNKRIAEWASSAR